MRQLRMLVSIILCLGLIAGLWSCAGRSAGRVLDDTSINTTVKTKLLQDEQVSGTSIDVDTHMGEVTLTGTVESAAIKQRAEAVAKEVEGVRKVNNLLKVNPQ